MLIKSVLREVTSDKLYLPNSKEIDQDGLLSEKIFGTTKNLSCSCGNLKGKQHLNKSCPKCHTICEPSSVRYQKFGKITLPIPILNFFQFKSLKKKLPKSIRKNFFTRYKINELFLSFDQSDFYLVTELTENCIPIRINSPFSLYLAAIVAYKISPNPKLKELIDSFYDELLVLPPDCRVVVVLKNNSRKLEVSNNEIVRIYQNIIRIKKVFHSEEAKLIASDIYQELIVKVKNNNYDLVDTSRISLIETTAINLQILTNQLYEEIINAISGKQGMIRQDFQGKNIDFSARAVVVNDPELQTHQIKIPRLIFIKLFSIEYINFLKKFKINDINTVILLSKIIKPISKNELSFEIDNCLYLEEFIDYFFKNSSQKERLIYINRQPTLWRYGLFTVEVIGVTEEDDYTIHVSPLVIPSLGMDFDGDTAALYKVHDIRSINEMYENSFILNLIEYDHNPNLVHGLTKEAKYGFLVLRNSKINPNLNKIQIQKLQDLKFNSETLLETPVEFDNQIISYGLALVNKFFGFDKILITSTDSEESAVKKLYQDCKSNAEYHERLNQVFKLINWFLTTHTKECISVPFSETLQIVKNNSPILQKLPHNQYIGYHIHQAEVEKIYNSLDENSFLKKLTNSNLNKTQFIRGLISIGYIADNQNKVSPIPIKSNIITGLSENEFFNTCFGSRKGIIDKERITPISGKMERDLVINLSTIEIAEDDCGSKIGFKIKILNQKHNESLINRYYLDEETQTLKLYYPHPENVGKTFVFRSPITCKTPNFKVCRKCVGELKFKSPYIGILTGQYIQERMTQLSMSSFHTSGSATLEIIPELKDFISQNILDIIEDNSHINIIFKTEIPENIKEILTKNDYFKCISIHNNTATFEKYYTKIDNHDIGKIINEVKKLFLSQEREITPINEAYEILVKNLHQVSNIYSVFFEIILTNIYLTEENEIFRYALHQGKNINITKKLNISLLHKIHSPILSLIYQPNHQTILNYYSNYKNHTSNLSIYEKIWNECI